MSAQAQEPVDQADEIGREPRLAVLHWIAPALVSVTTFLVIDIAMARFVGRPWGPAYPMSMDALVLLRMGPLFFSGLIVWPAMRARGATRGQALLGIWATPIAFAIVSAWRAADFFPPWEAAYYGTNPMVVGALGAQLSSAGIGALIGGAWRRRKGQGQPVSWWAAAAVGVGTAVTVFAVLWDGGQHLFYPWVQIYGELFG
jgi:hypothetical protein